MFVDAKFGSLTEPLTGRTWNSKEIQWRMAARVERYRAEKLSRGDRILIHYGNSLDFFVDLLAAWYLGASVVPVDTRLTAFEIENLARAVSPHLILVDGETDAGLVSGMTALGVKVVDAEGNAGDSGQRLGNPPSPVRLDDEALILFTSGSTGAPKGVVHTHRSLRARWMALRQSLGVDAYRRTLCLLPTHFGHGLICNCLFPWLSGLDLLVVPPFNPALLMQLGRLVDEHEVTFISSVPSMWELILKVSKAPRSGVLRRIHCGSAPLSAHLWKQIQEWGHTREVFNAYGITETGSWVAGTSMPDFVPEDGLVGVPWGAVISVLKTCDRSGPFDPDARSRTQEAGYIWINTPALMQGYYGRQEATDQVVSGGWFLTGDIGLIDERGWLYLKGRERDEINKGGTKIYPADIDAVVERFEGSKGVCAFGFADPLYGQNVAMAVVLTPNDAETIRRLHSWMKRHLADFKMPARWYVVESLPHDSRGKVSRAVVQQDCAQRTPIDLPAILTTQP